MSHPGATSSQEPPIRRVVLRAALMLLATAAVLLLAGLALWRTELGRETLADLLQRSNPLGLLAGIVVISLAMPIAAIRWRALMPEPVASKGSVWTLTWIQCVAVLFNYALPGPVGELVAAGLVKRRYGIRASDALMASMVVRLLGLGVAATIAALVFALAPLPIPEGWREAFLTVVVVMAVGASTIALAAAMPRHLQAVAHRIFAPFERLPGRAGRWALRLRGVGDHLLDALSGIGRRGPKPLLKATAWTFVGHTVSPTGVAIAAWSLGMGAGWAGVVFTNAFVIVGALALYLFPGSQLGWDAMYCAVFAGSTGVPLPDAATITAVARVQQSLIVLLGIFALLFLARGAAGRVSAAPDAPAPGPDGPARR